MIGKILDSDCINHIFDYRFYIDKMSLLKSGKAPKVFSIQVSGIKCTNCAGKIKKGLGEGLNDPETKIAVNIIQEKVSLTVFKDSMVQKAVEILIQIGFPPIGEPVPISGG